MQKLKCKTKVDFSQSPSAFNEQLEAKHLRRFLRRSLRQYIAKQGYKNGIALRIYMCMYIYIYVYIYIHAYKFWKGYTYTYIPAENQKAKKQSKAVPPVENHAGRPRAKHLEQSAHHKSWLQLLPLERQRTYGFGDSCAL